MKGLSKDASVALFLIICLSLSTTITESANGKHTRKKISTGKSKAKNICDIEQSEAPFYCYCNDNSVSQQAETVNCLIFRKCVTNDPAWDFFSSQMYLKHLSFVIRDEGAMNYIPINVLRQFKTLYTLQIQDARLTSIQSKAFADLPTVSTINLNKNYIYSIHWHAFEGLKNLTVLNLNDNFISELNRDQFYDVPKMQTLYLNNNNVTKIDDSAFKHLPTLQGLELNNNQIKTFIRESFMGLHQLHRLSLRNNLIAILNDRVFYEMSELQELDLSQNKISFISELAFDGMKNLRKLRLADNQLVSLERDVLAGAPNINLLDLRENKLRTMTFDNVKPIITNFYTNSSLFYIDNNELICDCNLQWIWGLRNETKNYKLKQYLDDLTCFLEVTNEVNFEDELERNRALEIARNSDPLKLEEYVMRGGREDTLYMNDDGVDDEFDSDNDNDNDNEDYIPENKVGHSKVKLDGKIGFMKSISQLKPEELPCPKPTREDLMASEQPSGRRDLGSSSSIFSFVSSGNQLTSQCQRSLIFALSALLLIVLPRFFT